MSDELARAWQETEASLPASWQMWDLKHDSSGWVAMACLWPMGTPGWSGVDGGYRDTPAEALRALAERLKS